MTEFYAVIDRDEDGQFFAYVPELPGCHTCGETMEELLENLEEAIALYLEVVEHPREFPSMRKVAVGEPPQMLFPISRAFSSAPVDTTSPLLLIPRTPREPRSFSFI